MPFGGNFFLGVSGQDGSGYQSKMRQTIIFFMENIPLFFEISDQFRA